MSLIDEPKRRNVIRVGGAYLALGWVVMQVTGTVAPAMRLPDWTVLLVAWIGVIGFPFVLAFSWVFELTPEGLKRETEVERSGSVTHLTARRLDFLTIGFVVLGVLLFAADRWAPREVPAVAEPASGSGAQGALPQQVEAPAVEPGAAKAAPDDRSIAVLPFDNRSKAEDDAFFVDGIHDDLLTQLSRISALKVISRTSVEQFRDTRLAMKDIAAQLGVTRIVEGAVQRAGDRVRINVQLIDAGTDAHLWAETYDRELTTANIFAIQSEVASAIAGALQARLTAGEQARVDSVPTQSLAAWEAWQLGKQRMARRTSASLKESEQFFRDALALDPAFALAHVGLADALMLQTAYSDLPRGTGLAAAQAAVDEALAIDPNLAEASASAANIAHTSGQLDRADGLFRRAIELGPSYATTHHWYSGLLFERGRLDESLRHAERAAELDPLSAIINSQLAAVLAGAGRFEEAVARTRRVLAIDPSLPNGYTALGGLQAYAFNRYAEAVPLVQKAIALDDSNPQWQFILTRLYLDLGEDEAASRHVAYAAERWPGHPAAGYAALVLHLTRGDPERVQAELDTLLAADPRDYVALLGLRNIDLRAGRPEAARARYEKGHPELVAAQSPDIGGANWAQAVDLATVLQRTGEGERARLLLDRSEAFLRTAQRLGPAGYGASDVQIHALRGDKSAALGALSAAAKAGWRAEWRYTRDHDPSLEAIRAEPEFKAVFADIERDMAAQRATLAANTAGAAGS